MTDVPDTATLRAAVDRVIPGDEWPAGWAGGVGEYLADAAGVLGWAAEPLTALVRLLDAEAQRSGTGVSFGDAFAATQDEILRRLADRPDGRPLVDALLRVCWEGYYAQTRQRRPAGVDMVGFHSVPAGVLPVEPPPLPAIRPSRVAGHYDAVIVGSGPGAGAAAWTLANAGKRVLVVERAANLTNGQLRGDHLRGKRNGVYDVTVAPGSGHPRVTEDAEGRDIVVDGAGDAHRYGLNAMAVGGGTRVWQGMAWRFLPEDFRMATTYGVPEGSSLADWPVGYTDMEAYYSLAERELGVSGEEGGLTTRTPRSAPYPMPAMASEPAREVLSRAADRLGWRYGPIPLAINSVPRDGRPACVRCAQCIGHACPVDAKNGSHNTFLPRALATGGCDLLTGAQVTMVEDGPDRARVVIVAGTAGGGAVLSVTAGVVVVSAGAVETPRLLLASGIGNDHMGRHLHDHRGVIVAGSVDRPVKTFLGPGHSIATLDHVHSADAPWGGGVIFDLNQMLPLASAAMARDLAGLRWGTEHKRWMRDGRARVLGAFGIGQEIPMPTSRVTVSPSVADRWGMPAARFRKDTHWTSRPIEEALERHARAWLAAAGVEGVVRLGGGGVVSAAGEHSCGTARMGRGTADSATRVDGRVHGTARVYACDSSLHPTNGSVNPTLTIIANCLRVADLIVADWP